MRNNIVVMFFVAVVCVPTVAHSEDARSILETAQQRQLERWEGVDSYVVQSSVMGNSSQTYFRRTEVSDESGSTHTLFLPNVQSNLNPSGCEGAQTMTAEGLEAYAAASEMMGEASATEIENGLEEAGLPRGLLAGTGSDPTATFDPRVIMGSNAKFLRGAAQAQRQQAASDPSADVTDHMAEFADRAKLVGTESIDGRKAYHLRVNDLNQAQEADGREYKMDAVSMWIDSAQYVPLRMKVDGTLTSAGETKPMLIETIQSDYRAIPDSKMYESFKRVMKISGMMDAAQEAQLIEAQAKLVEFEQQMASMPASQRQMMEKMMGPQLEMMRNMAAGGGFQIEVVTDSIVVNPPMMDANGEPCPAQ